MNAILKAHQFAHGAVAAGEVDVHTCGDLVDEIRDSYEYDLVETPFDYSRIADLLEDAFTRDGDLEPLKVLLAELDDLAHGQV